MCFSYTIVYIRLQLCFNEYGEAMARETFSTRLNEYEQEAFAIAAKVWGEHADKPSELLRAIINDWRRTRDDGTGSKTQKVIDRIDLAEKRIISEIRGEYGR